MNEIIRQEVPVHLEGLLPNEVPVDVVVLRHLRERELVLLRFVRGQRPGFLDSVEEPAFTKHRVLLRGLVPGQELVPDAVRELVFALLSVFVEVREGELETVSFRSRRGGLFFVVALEHVHQRRQKRRVLQMLPQLVEQPVLDVQALQGVEDDHEPRRSRVLHVHRRELPLNRGRVLLPARDANLMPLLLELAEQRDLIERIVAALVLVRGRFVRADRRGLVPLPARLLIRSARPLRASLLEHRVRAEHVRVRAQKRRVPSHEFSRELARRRHLELASDVLQIDRLRGLRERRRRLRLFYHLRDVRPGVRTVRPRRRARLLEVDVVRERHRDEPRGRVAGHLSLDVSRDVPFQALEQAERLELAPAAAAIRDLAPPVPPPSRLNAILDDALEEVQIRAAFLDRGEVPLGVLPKRFHRDVRQLEDVHRILLDARLPVLLHRFHRLHPRALRFLQPRVRGGLPLRGGLLLRAGRVLRLPVLRVG
mmetsp:Transcript_6030/g.22041  ORF Transcript_6030/g.22041 Transcript_6030/m.22041 type:complete len:482 (+) Transcript_6030:2651-4096(+)